MLEGLIKGENLELVIKNAIVDIHSNGPVNLGTLEKLSFIKKYHNDLFSRYESKLLSVMGLFYKLSEPQSLLEVIYNDLGSSINQQYGRSFTPMQARAYKSIFEKRFYSFSAPTSTGKSHLFRELIREYDNDIIIVVPSRALIAEFYATVIDIVDKNVLVLQFIENVNQHNTSRRIFIITPERGVELFKYADEFDVGLFLFDEAQISEEPIRGLSFDAFVRRTNRAFPTAKKVFAHPFVSNPIAQIKKHGFLEDSDTYSFQQNNVGKIFVAKEKDGSFSYFSPYSQTSDFAVGYDLISNTLSEDGTVLIYTSKSKIFNGGHIEGFGAYIDLCPEIKDEEALKIIDTLKHYIGSSDTVPAKQSSFIQLMQQGVVVHHGSMPLKARLLIEHFVRSGYARLCFATSTLNQGINMPFDCVLIDNFNHMEELTLKNLIGRSGRSSTKHVFDYGYTIVNRSNVATFSSRLNREIVLKESSQLDDDPKNIPEDYSDLVDAIKTDTFNDDLNMTQSQVDRIRNANLKSDIRYVLDKLVFGENTITATQYYELGDSIRTQIKNKLKKIYCSHLNKDKLSRAEQSVLSAAIPLLLWKVQGKSFSETLSLRYSFLTERDKRRALLRKLKARELTQASYNKELRKLKIRYSAQAEQLPNSRLTKSIPLFPIGTSVADFDYDLLVYDTYDYLDKVISLSLSDPLCAALTVYFEETEDERAKVLKNYLRFGTNNEIEIWLIKYGFDPEDIEWVADIVEHVDENGILFSDAISEIDNDQMLIIKRYVNQ
ncbi:DEAD/DEAH box helicase [Vibrio fluvialis]|uniref:DEAD/DEAH box helicase n=1 Tax=Vibrio fluvialis TaxID=676 RepID=UPI0015594415|nr:DEAD/DEAH box helicase [Vibrio fluvialis]